jgi:hypothetical protein
MHVDTYRLRLWPMLWSPPELTLESLAERLARDALIHEFAPHPSGGHVVGITLQRDRESHEEALNELLLAAQELGYTFVEAGITRVADRALEMAVGCCVGGLSAGASTEKGEAAAIGAVAGWLFGLFVGANMKKIEVMYEARWTEAGWKIVRVDPEPAPSRPALRAA